MSNNQPVGGGAAEVVEADRVAGTVKYTSQGAFDRDHLKESPGFYTRAWRRFRKDKIAMFGLFITIFMVLFAVFAPLISQIVGVDYAKMDLRNSLAAPLSPGHPLGTDKGGRDILVRLAYGGRVSMRVATFGLLFSLAFGLPIGSIAGYFGGAIDNVLMRFVDMMLSIPSITLLLLLSVWFRPGPIGLAFVIGLLGWMGVSRLIRGEVLALKNRDYVDAARVLGASNRQIITKHIFPNVFSIVIVWASLALPGLILYEASLSYLGFGVRMPIPSWGNMLNDSRAYFTESWAVAFFPGFFIFMTSLAINLMGVGLRDALDPRLNN